MTLLKTPILALALALAAVAAPAHADNLEISLEVNGASRQDHRSDESGHLWNESNTGVGIEARVPGLPIGGLTGILGRGWDTRYTAGMMRDLRGVRSEYLGAIIQHSIISNSAVHLELGAATMTYYSSQAWNTTGKTVTAAIAPEATLELRPLHVGINLFWLPAYTQDATPSWFAQATLRF